jgi:hypothetical protein
MSHIILLILTLQRFMAMLFISRQDAKTPSWHYGDSAFIHHMSHIILLILILQHFMAMLFISRQDAKTPSLVLFAVMLIASRTR